MDAVEFVDLIRSRFYFKDLYHFTDRSNLESIKEFGLLSKARLDELGISPLNPGGDEQSRNSDREHGIYNFVSLSFTPRNPMAYTWLCCTNPAGDSLFESRVIAGRYEQL
ncbi:DarT ssDNA thymidine ADP-ribosyltransferase family protein, partial [Phaeobacter gallaeciensis]|uniref:DarT ssDNA thymidine ADP-ribosyltransferase family protein n=1 Tax=Phaeobacter gallaeciensis TaxID=60890 RepID=UPI00237F832B